MFEKFNGQNSSWVMLPFTLSVYSFYLRYNISTLDEQHEQKIKLGEDCFNESSFVCSRDVVSKFFRRWKLTVVDRKHVVEQEILQMQNEFSCRGIHAQRKP